MDDYFFIPRAVIEVKRGGIYNAEVAFQGIHFILRDSPYSNYEVAKASAEALVTKMKVSMIEAAKPHVAGLKVAKE